MEKDAQKPDHVSLTTLVSRLREGRFVIPDFQREFAWDLGTFSEEAHEINIPRLLHRQPPLMEGQADDNFESTRLRTDLWVRWWNGQPEHIVLDGQQRLTAMYYAFVAPNVTCP